MRPRLRQDQIDAVLARNGVAGLGTVIGVLYDDVVIITVQLSRFGQLYWRTMNPDVPTGAGGTLRFTVPRDIAQMEPEGEAAAPSVRTLFEHGLV